MEDIMKNEKNKMYFTLPAARNISLRAHVRALSEEIKKRKALRKCEGLTGVICEQLLEMKREVRYLNLTRAYLKGTSYKTVERSTSGQNKVNHEEILRLAKHYLGSWQTKIHTTELVKAWLEAE
jgi:hypothetical protein